MQKNFYYGLIFFWGISLHLGLSGQTKIVYADELSADWENWSWGGEYNFDHTANVKAGDKALEASYIDGWGGLQLRSTTATNTDEIKAIRFWVKAEGEYDIKFYTASTDDGGASSGVTFKTSTNWEQKVFSISDIGNPGLIKLLVFQNFTGNANLRVFYDQIEWLVDDQPPVTTQTYIQVDQFGYLPEAAKVAVIADPLGGFNGRETYLPPSQLEVRNANSDAIVLVGNISLWKNGEMHAQSEDRGWWFDFSNLTTEGEYYIYDAENDGRSATFSISPNVYDEVLKAGLKMFYYNRCNSPKEKPFVPEGFVDGNNFQNALQDANCRFVYDPENASLERDMTGGWFDAGDYNKYVTFAKSTLHNLLWAYEENPAVFGDDWNIPESGNGLPDILDELKWELDWLLKMTNPDGTVHIKMGSIDFSDNAAAPPSNNFERRYYGPTCTSASLSNAGVFAHAAKVFGQFPAYTTYAETLKENAIRTWNYVLPHLINNTLETECDDGTIKAGDADREEAGQLEDALLAAIHLFDLTQEDSYNEYIAFKIEDAEQIHTTFWGTYKLSLNDALLLYTTLPKRNEETVSTILESANLEAGNNNNGYFGFNDRDLYRAFMPDWSYHWGSNQASAGYGVLNLQMKKYGIAPGAANSFQKKADEQLHYFHGVNPLGLVYLSNMYAYGGDFCVNEIYHAWFNDGTIWDHALNSEIGPAPGFLVGGPNHYFSVSGLAPPANQPRQKSYMDFNDGFPNNSWELSEPAIYYQAAYVRLLANYVGEQMLTANYDEIDLEKPYFKVRLLPNPSQDHCIVQYYLPESGLIKLQLLNSQGQLLFQRDKKSSKPGNFEEIISVNQLPAGIYWLNIHFNDEVLTERLVVRSF